MKLKNLTKSVSIILMLLAMLLSCQPVNDDGGSNNSGNNTTQEGGNNNGENNNDGNNSGNENSGNNQGGENNGNTEKPALKVTITFNTNGINETAPTTIETTSDKSVDLPALTNAKFSHWNTKADGSGLSYSGSVIFAESVTLYAIQLAENEFKITYVLDGGINNSANPFLFTEEDFIGLKNPSKDGYTFVGWYENRDFSGNSIKGWAAGDKTADVIIYAKWEKESEPALKVTITFNTNGINETAPTAIETTSDKSVDLPTLTNAKFSHWNTKADGSGLSYSGSVIFAESVTLYAIQLAENEFKITYVLDGGINNPKNKYTFTEDEYVALRDPTKDGYIFLGWYETANFSGEAIKLWFDGDKTADVTLYAKWRSETGFSGGSGVYSYTLNIEDISTAWGGNTMSPAFSVVLLTDEGLERCIAEANFKVNPITAPEYQIGAFGNMKIANTANTGNFKVYGAIIDDKYNFYEGIAATVTDTTLTLYIDMTKLNKTHLKALWEGDSEAVITEEDYVDLTGYKPYVVALGTETVDPVNALFNAWSADVMKMSAGATFPTDLKEGLPTFNDLKYIYYQNYNSDLDISEGYWEELTNNTFSFIAGDGNLFEFTNSLYSSFGAGAMIEALDTEYALTVGKLSEFGDDVLTVGNKYKITLIVNSEDEAYVKVSEIPLSSLSIASNPYKTSYFVGEELDLTGLAVEAYYSDDSTSRVEVTLDMVSGFDSSVPGVQTLTVTYSDCTATFDVEVVE